MSHHLGNLGIHLVQGGQNLPVRTKVHAGSETFQYLHETADVHRRFLLPTAEQSFFFAEFHGFRFET
jgi:hypothetical protein